MPYVSDRKPQMRSASAADSPDLCQQWEYYDANTSGNYKPGDITVKHLASSLKLDNESEKVDEFESEEVDEFELEQDLEEMTTMLNSLAQRQPASRSEEVKKSQNPNKKVSN